MRFMLKNLKRSVLKILKNPVLLLLSCFFFAQEMQLLLLKYREEIIAAKVAKEHGEETLKSEQVFLRSQLLSEQEEKQRMEDTLSQEISALQAKASKHSFCMLARNAL